jgi:hypothetical protein
MAKPKLTPQTPGEPLPDEITQAPEAETDQQPDQPTTTEADPAVEEAPAVVVTALAPGELPDADSIDPTQIERSVLTKQGWVVPHKAG